jgi:hypothetical protein
MTPLDILILLVVAGVTHRRNRANRDVHGLPPRRTSWSVPRARLRLCARARRVGTPARAGAPLTKPDLWASHPAFRDAGVLGCGRARTHHCRRAGPVVRVVQHQLLPQLSPSSVSCLGPMFQIRSW